MSSQPRTIKFSKHWGSWAKGYLNLAEIGLRDFKGRKNLGRTSRFSSTPKIFSLQQGSTLVACVWNIKHGLELIIKGLGINIDKKFWAKHDVGFLLNDLESKLKGLVIQKHVDVLGER